MKISDMSLRFTCGSECWRESECADCGRPVPPIGRSVALEAVGRYCDRECPASRNYRRRHLWSEHDDARHYADPFGWSAHLEGCADCRGDAS